MEQSGNYLIVIKRFIITFSSIITISTKEFMSLVEKMFVKGFFWFCELKGNRMCL